MNNLRASLPLILKGAISDIYIGEIIDAAPTDKPPKMRAITNVVKLGAIPLAALVKANAKATAKSMRFLP
jgi:hypothetical protein